LLAHLGTGEQAMRAFCIHPLLQSDADLAAADLAALSDDIVVMALAMEYRSVANAYSSSMGARTPADIRLSPLTAVNDRLRADKVQNDKALLAVSRRGARTQRQAARILPGVAAAAGRVGAAWGALCGDSTPRRRCSGLSAHAGAGFLFKFCRIVV